MIQYVIDVSGGQGGIRTLEGKRRRRTVRFES